jgi:NAD(P)-dependent dehydrogenase (short-subunit alcohol dehydrogenase family)
VQRIFITGAGRGIGLELARQYVQRGDRVLAGCRAPERAPALRQLLEEHGGGLSIIPLEVTDTNSIVQAVRQAGREVDGLDVLINNAATNPGDAHSMGPDGQPVLDAAQAADILRVNAVAPVVVAQSFLALLRAGANPRVVNISSGAGSLTRKTGGGDYIYPASKAALNMFTRVLAGNVRAEGVTAVVINPGWVKTAMGGPNARLEPAESARGLLAVIDALTPADSGRFLSYDGSELPW